MRTAATRGKHSVASVVIYIVRKQNKQLPQDDPNVGTDENLCMRKCGLAVEVIHPSHTHAQGKKCVGLVRRNNDETSIKGNLLFCFMNVFHVRGQSVSSGFCISKRIGSIVALD